MSLLSIIGGQFTNACGYAVVCGALGYLGARVIKQIDPAAALICGATAGVITALFFNDQTNTVVKIIGFAILTFAPFKLCEMLQLPVAFQACLIVTSLTTACALLIQHFQDLQEGEKFDEEIQKELDAQLDINDKAQQRIKNAAKETEKMHEDFDNKKEARKAKFEDRKKQMHEDFLKKSQEMHEGFRMPTPNMDMLGLVGLIS